MTAVSDAYRECFLYVDADSPGEVLDALARHLGVEPDSRTLAARGFQLDVVGNDARTGTGRDDFVDWGSKVEVYSDSVPSAEVVRFVTELMAVLRSHGQRVVAACDFEDELPQTDLV